MCTHPYCYEPAENCQADHIEPYAEGGPTTQENGRLLCGFHNRLRIQRAHEGDHRLAGRWRPEARSRAVRRRGGRHPGPTQLNVRNPQRASATSNR